MKRKITAALLASTMLVPVNVLSPMTIGEQTTSIMQSVQAATTDAIVYEGKCGASATWKFDENTGELTISGSGKMFDYSCDTKMGNGSGPWGMFEHKITSLTIGDEITYIGAGAFTYCKNITTITIGEKVEAIGQRRGEPTFSECALKKLYIGESFKYGLEHLISAATDLQEIQVSAENKDYCVENNILMSKDKTKIYAVGKTENRIFTVPSPVTEIDKEGVFCKNIDEIQIEEGNETFVVENGNLYKKSDMTKVIAYVCPLVTVPTSSAITLTGDDFVFGRKQFCFEGSEMVKSIVLGKDVTLQQWQTLLEEKEDNVWGVTGEEEDADGSMTRAVKKWFPNLETVQVEEGNKEFKVKDGILYSKDGKTLLFCPGNKSGELKIPKGVTTISDAAFYECTKLKSVSIPDSVTSMYVNSIKHCEQLKTISIGKGLKEIKPIGCIVEEDGMFFYDNSSTKQVLFSKCNALKAINVASTNKTYSSKDGVLYNKKKTTLLRYPTQLAKDYVMPASVKNIYKGAFGYFGRWDLYNRYEENGTMKTEEVEAYQKKVEELAGTYKKCKVKSIRLSDKISEIPSEELEECSQCKKIILGKKISDYNVIKEAMNEFENVKIASKNPYFSIKSGIVYNKKKKTVMGASKSISGSITISGTMKSIADSAFEGCTQITSVKIGKGVKNIGENAFYGCEKLKSVSLPNTITKIETYAFSECDSITSFKIPAKTTSLGVGFVQSKNLKKLTVANGNTKFVVKNGILYDKKKTKIYLATQKAAGEVTIPDSVKTIGQQAFKDCAGLEKVVLGEKLEKIENEAFYNCTSLKVITFKSQEPIKPKYQAFFGVPQTVTIKLPKECFKDWKNKLCISESGLTDNMNWVEY